MRIKALMVQFVFVCSLLLLPAFSIVALSQEFAVEYAESNIGELVEETLSTAGANRKELEAAIATIETDYLPGLNFLLAHMPPNDAKTLSTQFLLEHVRGAYDAWNCSPWHDAVSEDLFFNDILPYANVSEKREAWRADFRKRFLPMVSEAQTPSEAAVILNQKLFGEVGVKYSTQRKRADQGPYESIEGGTASCTGLSILLIDACRAVGVPARFVGTPRWSDNSGNHSWVEIWDGDWKFTGAAEPTGEELNKGWFTDRASTAKADEPNYAIYAVSYRKTPLKFPMVWSRNADTVWSINVTDRYTKSKIELADDQILGRFRIIDPESGKRVSIHFKVSGNDLEFESNSKDESFDANDHVNVPLKKNATYFVGFASDSVWKIHQVETRESDELFTLYLGDTKSTQTLDELKSYLQAESELSDKILEQPFSSNSLSREEGQLAADMLWEHYLQSHKKACEAEMQDKLITIGDLEMKYDFKVFGEKPEKGHALFISMHGGGGAPARVNEQQWKNQIGLYSPEEGIYLAPRAPTDTWNLWHQSHIDAFFDRIILNFVSTGDIDPDRVYLMGYSAGGDGVFQLAPRMADRFAAASMMAGHPNETQPLGLRNLPFMIFMGGKDAAYKRNEIAAEWKTRLEELHESDPNGYEHLVTIYPEKGHWMDGEDASALAWMSEKSRNVWPTKLVWHQDDVTHERFYWLSVSAGAAKERTTVAGVVGGQNISIDTKDVEDFRLWLNDELLNLDEHIELTVNGTIEVVDVSRTIGALWHSLQSRRDRAMMAPAYVDRSTIARLTEKQ